MVACVMCNEKWRGTMLARQGEATDTPWADKKTAQRTGSR